MKSKEKMSWTDDRIGVLKRMWKEGKSAAEIAKALGKGVTRNAVIGKAHRMGLSGRPSPIKKDTAPKKKAAESAPARKKATSTATPQKTPRASARKPVAETKSVTSKKKATALREPEQVVPMEKEAVPPGGGVALIDLTERMCKWPIGDPRDADFTFCGLGVRQGTPYCPQHAAAAYQTSSRRGAAAVAHAVKEAPEDDEDEEEGDEVEVEDDEEGEDV